MENKKGCNFCKKSKKKFSLVTIMAVYILVLAIIGQIEIVKYILSFF
jgi:hypothetical protein